MHAGCLEHKSPHEFILPKTQVSRLFYGDTHPKRAEPTMSSFTLLEAQDSRKTTLNVNQYPTLETLRTYEMNIQGRQIGTVPQIRV